MRKSLFSALFFFLFFLPPPFLSIFFFFSLTHFACHQTIRKPPDAPSRLPISGAEAHGPRSGPGKLNHKDNPLVPDADAHLARSEEGLPDSGKCGCKIGFSSVLTILCIPSLSLPFFFLLHKKVCGRSIYFLV